MAQYRFTDTVAGAGYLVLDRVRISDTSLTVSAANFGLVSYYTGANWGRDCAEPETADLRTVAEGDPSPDGVGTIRFFRGIEGGHIFQLGHKYTEAMGLSVLDEKGQSITPEMGCYGIGVTRLAAAVIEQSHDGNGMIWPDGIAPFRVILCPIGMDKSETVRVAVETLYAELTDAGVEVLLDDRGNLAPANSAAVEPVSAIWAATRTLSVRSTSLISRSGRCTTRKCGSARMACP